MPLYLKHYRKFIKCLLNNEGMANTMLSLPLFLLVIVKISLNLN